jgi:hypothetical protein
MGVSAGEGVGESVGVGEGVGVAITMAVAGREVGVVGLPVGKASIGVAVAAKTVEVVPAVSVGTVSGGSSTTISGVLALLQAVRLKMRMVKKNIKKTRFILFPSFITKQAQL